MPEMTKIKLERIILRRQAQLGASRRGKKGLKSCRDKNAFAIKTPSKARAVVGRREAEGLGLCVTPDLRYEHWRERAKKDKHVTRERDGMDKRQKSATTYFSGKHYFLWCCCIIPGTYEGSSIFLQQGRGRVHYNTSMICMYVLQYIHRYPIVGSYRVTDWKFALA